MNDLESDLRALLADRAGSLTAAPERHETTLGRARTRRRVTAGVALLTLIAIMAGGVVLARSTLFDSKPIPPVDSGEGHTTTGPYGFTSTRGTRPVVARGTFRDTTWVLRGERQRMKGIDDAVRLELTIERGGDQPAFEADTVVTAGDDVLQVAHAEPDVLSGEADVVFGATVPGIDSVSVDFRLDPPPAVAPHVFRDYALSAAVTADYFIAFVPPDEQGWVAARNDIGIDLESEVINSDGWGVPQIASGQVGRPRSEFDRATNAGLWWVAFRGFENRACLVWFGGNVPDQCFSRVEVENRGPLLAAVFEYDEATGLVALLRDDVVNARLKIEGRAPVILPWTQPYQSARDRWPLRIVAVGVDPNASGELQALDPRGKVIGRQEF